MLRIKRNTGLMGAGSKIKVSVNNEKVATIKQNKQIELELPVEEAKVSVSQFGIYSNELIVKEGQVVEVTTQSWTHISFFFFLILTILTNLFITSPNNIIVVILLIVLYFGIHKFIDGYNLKIIYP